MPIADNVATEKSWDVLMHLFDDSILNNIGHGLHEKNSWFFDSEESNVEIEKML